MTPLQNGTLLALGTVAAVAAAGVVHQRGMRGSGLGFLDAGRSPRSKTPQG